MTNTNWTSQIAEYLNNEDRVTEGRITNIIIKLTKEYQNIQSVKASYVVLNNGRWKIELANEERIIGLDSIGLSYGDLQSDEELNESIKQALITEFTKN